METQLASVRCHEGQSEAEKGREIKTPDPFLAFPCVLKVGQRPPVVQGIAKTGCVPVSTPSLQMNAVVSR
jgi:hypothetical protein